MRVIVVSRTIVEKGEKSDEATYCVDYLAHPYLDEIPEGDLHNAEVLDSQTVFSVDVWPKRKLLVYCG